jgi:hypothetical protein
MVTVIKLLGLEEAARQSGGSLLGKECRTFADSLNHAVADKAGKAAFLGEFFNKYLQTYPQLPFAGGGRFVVQG